MQNENCKPVELRSNGIFSHKKRKRNAQQVENDEYIKIDFTVDEGKEWLDPSREKN